MQVHHITARDTHALRLLVLRQGGTLADCDYAHDNDDGTFHLAVLDADHPVCIGSFYAEKRARLPGRSHYRLRGMATHPVFRGQGMGAALMHVAFEHLREIGVDRLWCNARLRAVPFYERLGLITEGPEFDIPGIGAHYLMHRAI